MATQETWALQDEKNQATVSKGKGELFYSQGKIQEQDSSPSQNDIETLEKPGVWGSVQAAI